MDIYVYLKKEPLISVGEKMIRVILSMKRLDRKIRSINFGYLI